MPGVSSEGPVDENPEERVDAANFRHEAVRERHAERVERAEPARTDQWWLCEPTKTAFDKIVKIIKEDRMLSGYRQRAEAAELAREGRRKALEAEREKMAADYNDPAPKPFRRNELRQPEFDEVAAWVAAKALELALNWREALSRGALEYIYPNGLTGELAARLADEAAKQQAGQNAQEGKKEETAAAQRVRAQEIKKAIRAELKEVEKDLKGQEHPFKGKGRPPSPREFIEDMRTVWEMAFGRVPGWVLEGETPFMKVCRVALEAAHPRTVWLGGDAFRKTRRKRRTRPNNNDKTEVTTIDASKVPSNRQEPMSGEGDEPAPALPEDP